MLLVFRQVTASWTQSERLWEVERANTVEATARAEKYVGKCIVDTLDPVGL
jgi:hypothetical protein